MTHKELKALRLRLGLTVEAMAEQLGIGWRMYYYIESGERPLSKASAMLAEQMAKQSQV